MIQPAEKVFAMRPPNALKVMDPKSRACLLNSRDILKVLKDREVIIMACNIRIRHAIPGIMKAAEELDAVVAFELARSEGDLKGGYTGQTPEIFARTVLEYADQTGFSRPFFIHGDHITVKKTTPEAVEDTKKLIEAELAAGYTSFAIDASFNELHENTRVTTELAQPIIKLGIGLEVEVGEIKSAGQEAVVTSVEEARDFILGLKDNGVHPDMLAINNGSKHGNYLEGEPIHIDLERTGEIYQTIKPYGVVIAQHGITGTPLHLVGRFADYGIRKGNVGTQWQNVAHAHLPEDLFSRMKAWAKAEGKDVKMATKVFKAEIDGIPEAYKKQILDDACETAKSFFKAFRAEGTGSLVIEELTKN